MDEKSAIDEDKLKGAMIPLKKPKDVSLVKLLKNLSPRAEVDKHDYKSLIYSWKFKEEIKHFIEGSHDEDIMSSSGGECHPSLMNKVSHNSLGITWHVQSLLEPY